nr:hypothetical protein PF009_g21281 [Phytophthora fragariae]
MPLGQHRPHSSFCAVGEELRDQQRAPRPAAAAAPAEAAAAAAAALPGSMHALPGSRAGHCRTATMTTSSSSSGIAGVDARPAWKPSWPLPHRHHDHQQQQ